MASGNQTRRWGWIALVAAAAVLAVSLAAIGLRGKGAQEPPVAQSSDAPVSAEALEEQARASPNDPTAWARLGEARFARGEFDQAVAAYARATGLDSKGAGYWSALGEARVMASQRDPMPPAALDAFHKAIALDAKDPRARYFLGVAKDLGGDHAGAIADWLALLGDTPTGAPWERDLVRTIEQVGTINKIDVADRIAKARPAGTQLLQGFAGQGIPGPDAAQIDAAKSLTPAQQDAMVRGMVGRLEARLKGNPADLQGWVMLMRSRATLGDRAAAAKALRDAVAANPGAKAELEAQAASLGIAGG